LLTTRCNWRGPPTGGHTDGAAFELYEEHAMTMIEDRISQDYAPEHDPPLLGYGVLLSC